jgi:hemerythrin
MALLQWKEEYSVGIAAVDHEHKELINLVNQLHNALTAQASKSTVEEFLGDLFRSISAHFALEEKFMRDHQYDQLTQHKQDHEQLLEEIRGIMDGVERNQNIDDPSLCAQLDAWFSHHFETHDARLHRALGAHPT